MERDLEKEMWTAGYKWRAGGRWRRQDRAGGVGDEWGAWPMFHPNSISADDQRNTVWKRYLEKEMWTAGYKYSWRKMKAAAQNRYGYGEEWLVTLSGI